MVWHLIDPQYYGQALTAPAGATGWTARWYQDDGHLDTGELLLWLDTAHSVAGFQLSHTAWPHGTEHIAEWSAGEPLRLGEVDSGEGGDQGPARHMTPVIRRLQPSDPRILQELSSYFLQHALVLEPAHRTAIARVLTTALQRRAPDASNSLDSDLPANA